MTVFGDTPDLGLIRFWHSMQTSAFVPERLVTLLIALPIFQAAGVAARMRRCCG